MVTRINNCRDDLGDISAKTKTLVYMRDYERVAWGERAQGWCLR